MKTTTRIAGTEDATADTDAILTTCGGTGGLAAHDSTNHGTNDEGACVPATSQFKTPQQVAEETLGDIDWASETTGYLDCPGLARHTTADQQQDCRVFVDGTPTITCFHQSCEREIKEANNRLRSAFGAELVWNRSDTILEPTNKSCRNPSSTKLQRAAAEAIPNILLERASTIEELEIATTTPVPLSRDEQFKAYLSLYPPDAILWCGDTYDTGKEKHAECFKTVEEWIRIGRPTNPLFCTSRFKPGSYSRCAENVLKREIFVVEFDRIDPTVDAKLRSRLPLTEADKTRNKEASIAVIMWLRDVVGLHLLAVVDSGNKSVHAHFECPGDECFDELRIVLPAMMADGATLRIAQPVRLPGFVGKDGRDQRLLYLDTDRHDFPTSLPSDVLLRGGEYSLEEAPPQGSSSISYNSPGSEAVTIDTNQDTSSISYVAPSDEGGSGCISISFNSSISLPPVTTTSVREPSWPQPLLPVAFHGLAGDVVKVVEPHTEADSAALLIQFLTVIGNVIGRDAYIRVGSTKHHLNLFAALVGSTSKARKGTSWEETANLVKDVDSHWYQKKVVTGLTSGEGLIWEIRDPSTKEKKKKGMNGGPDTIELIQEPGVSDKRLFVKEEELANVLKVMTRECNILSPIIRQAWDGSDLRTLAKTNPATCSGPHISIVGHITSEELIRQLSSTEAANGFANRFLWVAVKRSKCLPEGGQIKSVDLKEIISRLRAVLEYTKGGVEIQRSEDTKLLWAKVYPTLSEGKHGMLGVVTARAEAQVTRLSALYAILDKSSVIKPEHHEAAMAVWKYCEDSARWIFGDSTGDKIADKIHAALKKAGTLGLSKTDINGNVFSRNVPAYDLDEALRKLWQYGCAEVRTVTTEKSTCERWFVKER